jgi:hypothetical protein
VRKANSVQTSCGNMLTEIDIIAHYFMRDFEYSAFLPFLSYVYTLQFIVYDSYSGVL